MSKQYIFFAGAPGSKWSYVAKKIYFSSSIDNSDYREENVVRHYSNQYFAEIATYEIMHIGSYFDPGMEFSLPEQLSDLDKEQLERIFDTPFSKPKNPNSARIIKSHIFCYKQNLEYLRSFWPECPIVMVYRNDQACLEHWVKTGHFDIPYPDYKPYYKNLDQMTIHIKNQNAGLQEWWHASQAKVARTPMELCELLSIECPNSSKIHSNNNNFAKMDTEVKVI